MKAPVLYINCHDAGRLIQPYGHPVSTPHLQCFAEESVFFRNAHTVSPTCSPSRAALLTGRFPHQAGLIGLAHRGFQFNDHHDHLAIRLRKEGYLTALSGVEHTGTDTGQPGAFVFDAHLTQPVPNETFDDRDRRAAEAAARFIEDHADDTRPFYLECGFFAPHRPYPEEGKELPGDPAPPAYLPDTPGTRADMRAYAASVRKADACFGLVFDALRRTGLDRRALIIVTTDHGPPFPWAKCHLNDAGTGVMLMLRLPGVNEPLSTDALVTHLDIRPTLHEALGLPAEDTFEGKSLLPLIRGETDRLHTQVISELNFHVAYEPVRSVRTQRYRYTRRFDPQHPKPVVVNMDGGASKQTLLEAGLRDMALPEETLHDLLLDPTGNRNLIGDPAHATLADTLRTELRRWMERTKDPLLAGPLIPPAGAQLSTPEA